MHPKRLEQNQLTEKAAHDKQDIVDIIAMGALPKKHGGTCHKRTLSHNMFATKTTTSIQRIIVINAKQTACCKTGSM